MNVLRRREWRGQAVELGDLFRLTKETREAACAVQTHPLGWEVRLIIGRDLVSSRVCRTEDDVRSTGEKWKAAMAAKGWS